MERWAGKIAIVTGASSGIGAALVKKLVKAGLIVVGLARRVERVQDLAKDLGGCKGKLHAVKCDMMLESDILAAFQWVADNLGPVHILVNNAGVVMQTTLLEGDTESWRAMVGTNLMATAIATREAVKVMREKNIAGHIVHVNSVAGNRNLEKTQMYGATKHGIASMAEMLRHELREIGSQIKLTSIYPGLVNTEMMSSGGEEVAKFLQTLPNLKPDAVADSIMYALGTAPDVQIAHLTIQAVGEAF